MRLLPSLIWKQETIHNERTLYLTFDDGPTPLITDWVLTQLKQYDAKATFFCLGKNVVQHPELYQKIVDQQHSIGNHTFHHLNGWKTMTSNYISDVKSCTKVLPSSLFRPPYGRITFRQARSLRQANYKIIMWSILSGDFDANITAQQCAKQTIASIYSGAIVVFHDSQKAFSKLQYALPAILDYGQQKGYQFKSLDGVEISK